MWRLILIPILSLAVQACRNHADSDVESVFTAEGDGSVYALFSEDGYVIFRKCEDFTVLDGSLSDPESIRQNIDRNCPADASRGNEKRLRSEIFTSTFMEIYENLHVKGDIKDEPLREVFAQATAAKAEEIARLEAELAPLSASAAEKTQRLDKMTRYYDTNPELLTEEIRGEMDALRSEIAELERKMARLGPDEIRKAGVDAAERTWASGYRAFLDEKLFRNLFTESLLAKVSDADQLQARINDALDNLWDENIEPTRQLATDLGLPAVAVGDRKIAYVKETVVAPYLHRELWLVDFSSTLESTRKLAIPPAGTNFTRIIPMQDGKIMYSVGAFVGEDEGSTWIVDPSTPEPAPTKVFDHTAIRVLRDGRILFSKAEPFTETGRGLAVFDPAQQTTTVMAVDSYFILELADGRILRSFHNRSEHNFRLYANDLSQPSGSTFLGTVSSSSNPPVIELDDGRILILDKAGADCRGTGMFVVDPTATAPSMQRLSEDCGVVDVDKAHNGKIVFSVFKDDGVMELRVIDPLDAAAGSSLVMKTDDLGAGADSKFGPTQMISRDRVIFAESNAGGTNDWQDIWSFKLDGFGEKAIRLTDQPSSETPQKFSVNKPLMEMDDGSIVYTSAPSRYARPTLRIVDAKAFEYDVGLGF